MKKTFEMLFAAWCATLFYGCATPVFPPVFVEPGQIDEPEVVIEISPAFGRLTLIRTEPEPTAEEVLVYTNGVLLAVIGNTSYVQLDFQAGRLMLTLDWQDTPIQFEEEIVLDTAFSTNKFIIISHKFDVPEISKIEGTTDYTMEETLILFELPERFATNVIKNLESEYSYVF